MCEIHIFFQGSISPPDHPPEINTEFVPDDLYSEGLTE